MIQHNQLVTDYLAAKTGVWTPGTIKATASRLMQYSPCQDAAKTYNEMVLKGYKPYYIKITFISLSGFTEWQRAHGRAHSNPYQDFMQRNPQLFRNAYTDNYTTLTQEQYETELQEADPTMQHYLALLGLGGCRLAELNTYDGSTVKGKGSKHRRVFIPERFRTIHSRLSEHQIRNRLKHNPHSYRKLAADTWLRNGIDLKTVQVLLGHTSLASTQRYLRPMEADSLKAKLEGVWEEKLSLVNVISA